MDGNDVKMDAPSNPYVRKSMRLQKQNSCMKLPSNIESIAENPDNIDDTSYKYYVYPFLVCLIPYFDF